MSSLMSAAIQGLPPLPKSLSGWLNFNRESMARESMLRSEDCGKSRRSSGNDLLKEAKEVLQGAHLLGGMMKHTTAELQASSDSSGYSSGNSYSHHHDFSNAPSSSDSPGSLHPAKQQTTQPKHYQQQVDFSKIRAVSAEESRKLRQHEVPLKPQRQVLQKRSSHSLGLGYSAPSLPPSSPALRLVSHQSSRSPPSSPRNSLSSLSVAESPASNSGLPVCPYSLWPGGMTMQMTTPPGGSSPSSLKPGSLNANLAILRTELVDLRKNDMKLLCQLWTLNEKINEMKKHVQESPTITEEEEEEDDKYLTTLVKESDSDDHIYVNPINSLNKANDASVPKTFAHHSLVVQNEPIQPHQKILSEAPMASATAAKLVRHLPESTRSEK